VEQKEVKNILNEYLECYGIKARHVAKQLNIDETIISHFRHDRKELTKNDLFKLFNYLKCKYHK